MHWKQALVLGMLASFFLASAAKSVDEGQELVLDVEGGKPSLSVVYSYYHDFRWSIRYRTRLSAEQVRALPTWLEWNLYDRKTGNYFNGWQTVAREVAREGSLTLRDEVAIRNLLPRQSTTDLVFASRAPNGERAPRYYLPIGKFCQELAPQAFSDLTHPGKRCDSIQPSDIGQDPRAAAIPTQPDTAPRRHRS